MLIPETAYLKSLAARAEGYVSHRVVLLPDELPFEVPEIPTGMEPIGLETITCMNGDFTGINETKACLAVTRENLERALSGAGIAAVTGPIRVVHGQGKFKGRVGDSPEGEIPVVFAGDFTAVDPATALRTGREWMRWDGPGTGGLRTVHGAHMLTHTTMNRELTDITRSVAGHVSMLEDPEPAV